MKPAAKKKDTPRAKARGGAPPEIPLERLAAMRLALLHHIYNGEVIGFEQLDREMAKEIDDAIEVLRRIMASGKVHPRPPRVTQENLLRAALARDIIKVFKVSQEVAVEAAFPNGTDARTYRNLLPTLGATRWSVFSPPNLMLMYGFAAGLSKKRMDKKTRDDWAAKAREEFQRELAQGGTIKRK